MEKRRGRWTRLLAILLNLILVLENCLPVYAGGITPDTCSHADGSTVYRQISNKVHEYYCYACHQTLWYEACEPQYIAASDGSGHWAECKKCRGQMTGVMIHDKEGASKSVMVNGVSHTARSCSVCGYVSPLDAHDYEFRKETAQQAADCGAVCRLCGEESPYNKHFFLDYPWLNQPWNYNRKQHWGVCWKCGQEGKRTDHVWAERDDGKGGRERFCSTCGYNVGHPSSSHCKMHDHRYETLPESAGYHRKYCTICGMPDGAATKCTHVTLQTTDKAHTYTCSDCHQTWTEQHDFDVLRDQNAGSTDAGCKGKCNICGYVGWYPVYTYSWINNNGINTVSIGDHIWGTAVKNKHSAQDGHTHNITCVDCGFVKEENCDLTDPNGFYYKPDNSHPGQSHYKVCRKCGNGLSVADGTIENCTRYDYTQYNAYYHIRTCADCGAKWKGKGFEVKKMKINGGF